MVRKDGRSPQHRMAFPGHQKAVLVIAQGREGGEKLGNMIHITHTGSRTSAHVYTTGGPALQNMFLWSLGKAGNHLHTHRTMTSRDYKGDDAAKV